MCSIDTESDMQNNMAPFQLDPKGQQHTSAKSHGVHLVMPL